MTRLFLAAGVAALAIASPSVAKPGGGHGNGGGPPAAAGGGHGGGNHGGGGAPAVRGGGGGHGGGAPAFRGGGGGGRPAFVMQGGGGHGRGHGGAVAPRMQHMERQQARTVQRGRAMQRQQARNVQHGRALERQQARNVQRQQGLARQQARMAERQQLRGNGQVQQGRQQLRQQQLQTQFAQRGQARNRYAQAQQQFVANNGITADRAMAFRNSDMAFQAGRHGLINGCPPGLWMKGNGCMPPGQAAKLVGAPLATAAGIVGLSALPEALNYYYPATNDYYYRYGDGYLYQVNRQTDLISSLLPLMAGGYIPGEYLPQPYMASYVPDYWGLDSFYPDYGDVCNRYYYGVIYQVDCASGYVEGVIPMYAGGYGVGQILPSAYNYYNVPMQYRNVYYDTPDYGYWYAPGAIYQYDPRSSVITSVAALMSPGFSIGQPLPIGYDVYNVPMAYRATYYDTPSAWYRYNNGYIYQIDPVTQIVTAIVASLLT